MVAAAGVAAGQGAAQPQPQPQPQPQQVVYAQPTQVTVAAPAVPQQAPQHHVYALPAGWLRQKDPSSGEYFFVSA